MPLGPELPLFKLKLLAAFWLPERRLAAPVYLKTLSCLASTIHTSVPLVAMPSTWAFGAKVPGVQEPSNPPLVVVDVDFLVDVHDPNGGAGGGGRSAARGGVGAAQGGVPEGIAG